MHHRSSVPSFERFPRTNSMVGVWSHMRDIRGSPGRGSSNSPAAMSALSKTCNRHRAARAQPSHRQNVCRAGANQQINPRHMSMIRGRPTPLQLIRPPDVLPAGLLEPTWVRQMSRGSGYGKHKCAGHYTSWPWVVPTDRKREQILRSQWRDWRTCSVICLARLRDSASLARESQ